jgi:hypothetical protein
MGIWWLYYGYILLPLYIRLPQKLAVSSSREGAFSSPKSVQRTDLEEVAEGRRGSKPQSKYPIIYTCPCLVFVHGRAYNIPRCKSCIVVLDNWRNNERDHRKNTS